TPDSCENVESRKSVGQQIGWSQPHKRTKYLDGAYHTVQFETSQGYKIMVHMKQVPAVGGFISSQTLVKSSQLRTFPPTEAKWISPTPRNFGSLAQLILNQKPRHPHQQPPQMRDEARERRWGDDSAAGLSSMTILLLWLATPGNWPRWVSRHDRMGLMPEILERMHAHQIFYHDKSEPCPHKLRRPVWEWLKVCAGSVDGKAEPFS
ncbi:hypothetical protein PSTT_16726, partial [Puccinia striiformis]